jgi:hypothetical protein
VLGHCVLTLTRACSTEILCKWTLWEVISEPQAEKLVAFLKEKGVLFAEMTATFKKEHPEDAFRYGTARAIVPCRLNLTRAFILSHHVLCCMHQSKAARALFQWKRL